MPIEEQPNEALQLMWALQALAAPAAAQVALYPAFVVKTDELLLDFDNWYRAARGRFGAGWGDAQREALAALDSQLTAMARSGTDELYLESALAHDPRWERLRSLARTALDAFGWPVVSPPQDPARRGSYYVPGA